MRNVPALNRNVRSGARGRRISSFAISRPARFVISPHLMRPNKALNVYSRGQGVEPPVPKVTTAVNHGTARVVLVLPTVLLALRAARTLNTLDWPANVLNSQ